MMATAGQALSARANDALRRPTRVIPVHVAQVLDAQSQELETLFADVRLVLFQILIQSQDASLSVSLILIASEVLFVKIKDVLRSQTHAVPPLVALVLTVL